MVDKEISKRPDSEIPADENSPVSLEDVADWMSVRVTAQGPADTSLVGQLYLDDSLPSTRSAEDFHVKAASDRLAESSQSNDGVGKQQLGDVVRRLKDEGKDAAILEELLEYFDAVDSDRDGLLSKGEANSVIARRISGDLKLAGLYPEYSWQKNAAQADAVLAAGIGGEYAARMAVDSYAKLDEWQKANPEATPDMWQYAIGPLFLGKTLRERLDAGLNVEQMKELREFIDFYGNDRGYGRAPYYQNAIPDLLAEAIDLESNSPKTVDKNGDGKIDTREMLVWSAEYKKGIKLDHLDQAACTSLGFAIADSVPNPEWPFFEDLGWAQMGAFESADKDGDKIINPNEMNAYFKSEVWRKFDFRESCFQHSAKPDAVSLADVHWAFESADCFALADVGGRESAQLVADALKGIERNWSKYASQGGGSVKGELSVEQYANALATESSAALLERLSQGVSVENLKDYADIIAGLKAQFNITDEGFSRLVKTVTSVARRPERYDTNGDGRISAEELWQKPGPPS
ncbi:MAG TPA: hypothetical protein V6D17_24290 [Candidatus Obscuribacterales bacterium]